MRVLRKLVGGLVVATIVLVACPRAEASGIITHSWMARAAVPYVDDPDLRAVLLAHLDQIEGGAHFPDSGYVPGLNYGEESHWARFSTAYADQIREQPNCGDLTDPDGPCAERIAHLMGAVAHGIGDEVWDWLFEPNAVDREERYIPPALAGQFSRDGLELQMDMIAIGDYGRRTTPQIPDWPAINRLIRVYEANDAFDGDLEVNAEILRQGYVGIAVARNADLVLTQRFHDQITANMPWTSSHIVTAPGGIQFAARAIAAVWENLWGRMLGGQPDTVVGITYPAPGQIDVPAVGWGRSEFLPGSGAGRGGARTRIAAVLTSALPWDGSPAGPPTPLPTGAMTLTKVDGEVPVAIRSGYPKAVPYGPSAGEHTVGLQPDGNLEPCTDYRVDVTEELVDAEGNPVVPMSWTFTTDGCPGVVRRPDAQLRIGANGAFIGADVLAANGAGQGWTASAATGRTATFTVKLRNAGTDPDRLAVDGQAGVPGFAIRYVDGPTDVTNRVVAGTYRSRELAPGAAESLRVVVTVGPRARVGAQTTRLIEVASVAAPSTVDGVKLTVRRVAAGAARSTEVAPALVAELDELLARPDAARWIQVCQLDQS